MSVQQENRTDLDLIEKELTRARLDEDHHWTPEVQAMPRIQREEARRRAMDHVALLVRAGIEVLKRNKHPLADRYRDADHNIGDSLDKDDT